jgi:hypothetical protein
MTHLGREFTIEKRQGSDEKTYWIAINKARTAIVDERGQWVNNLSVDSDRGRFPSLALLGMALDWAETGKEPVKLEANQIVLGIMGDEDKRMEIRYRQLTTHQVMNKVMELLDIAPEDETFTIVVKRFRDDQREMGVGISTVALVSKRVP